MKNQMQIYSHTILLLITVLTFTSCMNSGPHPTDMTGKFRLTFSMKEGAINKEKINNSVRDAIKDVESEMSKAKKEIDAAFDVSSVDTTSIEGKIEYAAKIFGKSMSQLGTNMGDLGISLGGILGSVAENGITFSESILNEIEVNVELQQDGDIKADNSILNFGTANAFWEVKGDEFIISDKEKKPNNTLKIIERNSEGFVLEKEQILLHFKHLK